MACYEPNIIHVRKIPGQKAKILRFINSKGPNFPGYEIFDKENEFYKEVGADKEYIRIPCGDCIGCQEKYSKEWAVRCMLEAQRYPENYFITLTYDEFHLPMEGELVNPKTGEIFEDDGTWLTGTLIPEHMKKFIKDIRAYWKYHYKHDGIRFFACGEYGGQSQRPHYHLIMFNLPLKAKDLKVYKANKDGTILYTHPIIEKIWGKGFITIAQVNWDTCAYTARYVMKKMKGKIPIEESFRSGKIPEFIRMSRMPGIASDYFDENAKAIFENDEIVINGHKEKIQPVKPPRYFDKKYDIIYHDHMEQIKKTRKRIANENEKSKMRTTTHTIKDQLKIDEATKKSKWKSLRRDKV